MKRNVIICIFISILICFFGCANIDQPEEQGEIYEGPEIIDELYFKTIQKFDFKEDEYALYLYCNLPEQEIIFEEIKAPEQAALNFEILLIKTRGSENAEIQKPYKLSYDERNKAWLVYGTSYYQSKNEGTDYCGGNDYAIFDEKTGELLAFWGYD